MAFFLSYYNFTNPLLPPFLPPHANIIRSPRPSQLSGDGLALTIYLAAHITAALQSNCHPQVYVFLVLVVYLQAPRQQPPRRCMSHQATHLLVAFGIIRHDPPTEGAGGTEQRVGVINHSWCM